MSDEHFMVASTEVISVAISFMPLELTMTRRRINREKLILDGIVSRATAAKFRKGAYVSLEIIDRLCEYFQCPIEDIVEWIPNEMQNDPSTR